MESKRQRTDRSLTRLLREGAPSLSKSNMGLQSSAHVEDTGHADALVTHVEIEELHAFFSIDVGGEVSRLLLKQGRKDGLIYQNESEVQHHVIQALEDALETQGMFDEFAVRPEISIFAGRPDIVVVTREALGILLVIEVKKPGDNVFTSYDVGGQLYDYLVGQLVMGVNTPFAVLTSYDETCIAHLNDNGLSRQLLEHKAGSINERLQTSLFDPEPKNDSTSSPTPKICPVLPHDEAVGEDGDEMNEDEEDDDDESYTREVVYTQTFGSKKLISSLVLALRCGLDALENSPPRDLPAHGACAVGACAAVNDTGMIWRDFPSSVKFDYINFPSSATKYFFLWRHLGRGKSGQAFVGCNSTGRTCVLKFFFTAESTLHRNSTFEERQQLRALELARTKAEAEAEMQRWILLYPKFRKQVRVVMLNKLYCLLMPYMDPVQVEKRETTLLSLQECLHGFKTHGLKYRKGDLRWRHVGVRNNKCYLFDLGSLDPCPNSENDVQSQLAALRSRISPVIADAKITKRESGKTS